MSSIIPFLDESEAVFDNEEVISARNIVSFCSFIILIKYEFYH